MSGDKCCATCRFFAEGLVVDHVCRGKGHARRFVPGYICQLRPPPADKPMPATGPGRCCALWTDADTGEQPLRYALPPIYVEKIGRAGE